MSSCGGYGGQVLCGLSTEHAVTAGDVSTRIKQRALAQVCSGRRARTEERSIGDGGGEPGWCGRRGRFWPGEGGRRPMRGSSPARPEPRIWNYLGAGTGTPSVPGRPMRSALMITSSMRASGQAPALGLPVPVRLFPRHIIKAMPVPLLRLVVAVPSTPPRTPISSHSYLRPHLHHRPPKQPCPVPSLLALASVPMPPQTSSPALV